MIKNLIIKVAIEYENEDGYTLSTSQKFLNNSHTIAQWINDSVDNIYENYKEERFVEVEDGIRFNSQEDEANYLAKHV